MGYVIFHVRVGYGVACPRPSSLLPPEGGCRTFGPLEPQMEKTGQIKGSHTGM
jgi:hypothetical protein